MLLPELRARGLFWSDYAVPGGTYRENLYRKKGQSGPLPEHTAAGYRWRADVRSEEHRIPGNTEGPKSKLSHHIILQLDRNFSRVTCTCACRC